MRPTLAMILLLLPLLLVLAAPASAVDSYAGALAETLATHGGPDEVPDEALKAVATRFHRSQMAVRRDLYSKAGKPLPRRFVVQLPADFLAFSPLEMSLARGVLAFALLVAAWWVGSPPRHVGAMSPHVRTATGAGSFAPKLLALYLGISGLWEVAGAFEPETFPIGGALFFFESWAPAIRDWIAGASIFQAF